MFRTALAPLAASVAALSLSGQPASAAQQDWPSFNRTLSSERFAPQNEINRSNVAKLKQICAYEIGANTTFPSGLIVVGDTLYSTTPSDILAIDADSCRLKWRSHEDLPPGRVRPNRGPAYLDGRLFRGFQDGTVLAYDAASGRKLWRSKIGDAGKGETFPAAPLAWKGLVFLGNGGGDKKGVKGRMYALEAATGRVIWESYLVPMSDTYSGMAGAPDVRATWGNKPEVPISGGGTWSSYTLDTDAGVLYIPVGNPAPDFDTALRPGDNLFTNAVVAIDAFTGAYRKHYAVLPSDWHDWDLAATPSLVRTRAGRRILSVAPKDGYLYGFDLKGGERLYKTPTTTLKNVEAPLTEAGTHFCPGPNGGTEYNGPAYSPTSNMVYVGTVDWCHTVRLIPGEADKAAVGQPWTGAKDNGFGEKDPSATGWLNAVDADTGALRWKLQTPSVQLSGVTPTAGGLVFFGDGDGTAYALDQNNGAVLWKGDLGAAAGGGVITYSVGGKQRVAYAAGLTRDLWPTTKQGPARIVIWGLR